MVVLSDQYHREYKKSALYQLVRQCRDAHSLLRNSQQDLQNYIAQQQEIQKKIQNKECLRALRLRVVDPRSDMWTTYLLLSIAGTTRELFDGAYKWILNRTE